jgi:hypothetical protein
VGGISLSYDKKKMVKEALDIIEACRISSGPRAAFCRQLNSITDTGRQDGNRALINMLHKQIDRTAAHLFSPTDLRFAIDFENNYPDDIIAKGKMAARVLTRDFERSDSDMMFAEGVFEALKYGVTILKQWVRQEGDDRVATYHQSLLMPWQFGVYREDVTDISKQPAVCETNLMTLPEVWNRIYHLPDAETLFARIKTHAQKGTSGDEYNSFFHQVLSTSTLNTGSTGMINPRPGGIVQLNNDPNYATMGPQVGVDMVRFHELWVWGEQDYTTVQIIEPDILVAPRYKRSNLLISGDTHSGLQPYRVIRPNQVHGYFWGRSEIIDLIEPQGLLATWCDDVKRLFGLQIDKIIAFMGFDGITDEIYDQMRGAGYMNGPPGAQVTDLTPKMPAESMQMIEFMIKTIQMLGGFENIMGGGGVPGIRSAAHADTAVKMGSPQLRDRSLLVERQCASAADLRLHLMEAKDPRRYWTDPSKPEETSFMLGDIPEDRRVVVDSHSSSPIFADNHEQLTAFGLKSGILDGESAIEMLPYPQKDLLIQRFRVKEEKQAKLIQEHPELLEAMAKRGGHH